MTSKIQAKLRQGGAMNAPSRDGTWRYPKMGPAFLKLAPAISKVDAVFHYFSEKGAFIHRRVMRASDWSPRGIGAIGVVLLLRAYKEQLDPPGWSERLQRSECRLSIGSPERPA